MPSDLLKAFVALIVIVDPLGNIPIFSSLTAGMDGKVRRRTFNTATVVGFALLLIFTLLGDQLLKLFGISMESFMVAGGLLLAIISIKILIQGGWEERQVSPEDVGAVPIAFPLLVGPGAITTTMLILKSSGLAVAVSAVSLVFATVWLILRFIDPIYNLLGKTGSAVVARVMAVFIAAIAVQFIFEGFNLLLGSWGLG
ncbi:MarC family protein [Candidatus Bathyarchaeota archaeon]|nr:MarC family protein [Candidatus Bathyarchaeota archaeon]